MSRYKLSKQIPTVVAKNEIRVWTMKVTCTVPTGSTDDPNIFVYQTSDDDEADLFFDVADSRDMAVIPAEGTSANANLTEGAGAGYNNVPFYRVNVAVFDCNNACEMNRIWSMIKTKLQNLVWELDAQDASTWTETEYEVL